MPLLDGKVALISGGGSGIGRVATSIFAREGARVVVAEIDEQMGAGAAKALQDAGYDAVFVHTDVTSEASARDAVSAAISRFGRLDILYNNAGASSAQDGPAPTGDIDAFWKTIRLNLFGTWLMCRFAIPEIAKAGGGAVVNTASIAGLIGLHNIDAYTASKGGVIALTRSLAVEFAPANIRVNAVAPTQTLTERIIQRADLHNTGSSASSRNLHGPALPEDVANAAMFLASPLAARITGHTLPVDSGFVIS